MHSRQDGAPLGRHPDRGPRGGEVGINLNGTEPTVDFAAIGERRRSVISTLTGVAGLLTKNGVELISGEGFLTETGVVKVGHAIHTANTGIVLATGSVKKPCPASISVAA